MTPLLALGMPGPFEMMIIAGFGLLIFGRRLPEVGKGLARSIVEFKKGLREVTEEVENASAPSKPTISGPPAGNQLPPTSSV
jgi:sec-independent protein translocase protein TatA